MTRRRVLTDAQVRELRAAYQPGVRGSGYRELGRRFGIGESTVRDIITYRASYVLAVEQGGRHA